MTQSKRYYITKKRVEEFIKLNYYKFKNNDEFKSEVRTILKDLNEFPDSNKNQIRFYNKVLITI